MNKGDWWFEEINGITLIRFRHFEEHPDFRYFVTTRNSGLSSGEMTSFNIGFQEHDLSENVMGNRRSLASAMQADLDSFVFARQTHSDNIKIVGVADKGLGSFSKEDAIPDTDGFIVSEPGIFPVVMTADCVPVILFDPVRKVAGVFHAGWRGTVKLIAQKGLGKMMHVFETNPADVLVSIGPSIGPCCYEVGEDVVEEAKKIFPAELDQILVNKGTSKPHFDLWLANKIQLANKGIREENVIVCNSCTFDHPEHFYSARLTKGKTGRMAAGVGLL